MNFIFYSLIIFFALFIYLTVYLVLIPYLKYRKFLKYGKGQFYPLLGMFYYQIQNIKKNKSGMYTYQHINDDGTQPRVLVENVATRVVLKLLDHDLIQAYYQNEPRNYEKYKPIYDNIRYVKQSFFFSNYDKWKAQRQIYSGYFHFDYLRRRTKNIQDSTIQVFKEVIAKKEFQKQDLIDLFSKITSMVVIQSLVSENSDGKTFYGMDLTKSLAYFFSETSRQIKTIQFLLFGSKYFELGLTQKDRLFNKQIIEFAQLFKEIINERIEEEKVFQREGKESPKQDIINYLFKNNTIEKININYLIEDFMIIHFAGTDTTSHLSGMTIYYLSQYKHVKEKLLQEINNNDLSQVQNLPYLNALIKEALRFYTPIVELVPREAVKDNTLKDIFIPKGTLVNPEIISIHRNPLYYKNPHVFDPDRWLQNNSQPPFSFIPFSAGGRNCIGQHMGLMEARIIIYLFVKTFDFECDEDYDLKMHDHVIHKPIDPLRINLKIKENLIF